MRKNKDGNIMDKYYQRNIIRCNEAMEKLKIKYECGDKVETPEYQAIVVKDYGSHVLVKTPYYKESFNKMEISKL